MRRQRGETSPPRFQSLNPSSYRTPFHLSGPSQIEVSALELTWREHPVEYNAGDGEHRVACRYGTTARVRSRVGIIGGCKASCGNY